MSTEKNAEELAAFGQIVERYHNMICAIAYSRTGDRVASEDIAQETFLVAWRGASGLRDPNKMRAWLCSIARNLANKSVRGKRREVIEEVEHATGDPGPLDQLITKQDEAAVWTALQQLPPKHREPLVLFYREEQSIRQVAEDLGLSEETAKQRLSRGRAALRQNTQLVEHAVAAGRPRKAAVAAVLAALALVPRRGSAATTSKWKIAGVAGAVAAASVAVVVGVGAARSKPAAPRTGDATILAQLRETRAAIVRHGDTQACKLHGSVRRADGTAVPAVLIALVEHSFQSTALEPTIVQTDRSGAWKASLPAATYTLAASAPGYRAQARIVKCGADDAMVLAPGGTPLRGTISDVGGGGVAGVTVWAIDPFGAQTMFLTRTDAAGAYELGVAPGPYMVLAMHPEYAPSARPITLGDAARREDFRLTPGASIEGVVVDARGVPVPGATVNRVATPVGGDAPIEWQVTSAFAAIIPVVSDANGRFTLRGQTPGALALTARSSTLATAQPTQVSLALAEAKSGVIVTVDSARTITGFVVARDNERRGLANVQVVAFREGVLAAFVRATTDDAGHFELTGVPAGPHRILAIADGYVPFVSEDAVAGGDMLVRVDRGARLRGQAAPDSVVKLQPIKMDVQQWLRAGLARAVVDERGNFEFAAVAPGDYILSATTFDRRGQLNVRVDNSDQVSLRVALVARPAIAGTVVDDTGKPLAGAIVTASGSVGGDPLASLYMVARTDDRGAFKIVCTAGGEHDVKVFDAVGQRPWAGEERPFRAREIVAPASEKLVVAGSGARVTGVVVGPDQKPVADAWLDVGAKDGSYPALYQRAAVLTNEAGRFAIDGVFGKELVVEATASNGRLRGYASAAPGTDVKLELSPLSALLARVDEPVDVTLRQRMTDQFQMQRGARGELRLAAIPGEYELEVSAKSGYVKRTVTIGPAETRVDLTFTPWGSARGKVLGSDGKPWAGATVRSIGGMAPNKAETDGDGNFTLERLEAGHNELMIRSRADGWFAYEFELPAGQQIDLETITQRGRGEDIGSLVRAPRPQTAASASADLGLRFFVDVQPPPDTTLAAVARDPLLAYRGRKDPKAALWIVGVDAGGFGGGAGFRRGDRVVRVGMAAVGTGEEAAEMMMSLSTKWRSRGRVVRWVVARDGREIGIDVLLPEK